MVIIVDHMLCFQTMLTWVRHAASISECLALALSIQVLLNVPSRFFPSVKMILFLASFIRKADLADLDKCSGDSDIIKTLPGDQ